MIRPAPHIIHALAASVRQHPELLEWLLEWKTHELEQLPQVVNNLALAQGRCQVLGELYKLAKDAPTLVAKSSSQ
jgi:hypothetical protein